MDVIKTATVTFSKGDVLRALQAYFPDCHPMLHAIAGSPKSVVMDGGSDRVTVQVVIP